MYVCMYVCMYACITKSITKGTKLKKNYRNIAEQTQKLSHATQQSHFDMSDILLDNFPKFWKSYIQTQRHAPWLLISFNAFDKKVFVSHIFGKKRHFLSLRTKDLHLALLWSFPAHLRFLRPSRPECRFHPVLYVILISLFLMLSVLPSNLPRTSVSPLTSLPCPRHHLAIVFPPPPFRRQWSSVCLGSVGTTPRRLHLLDLSISSLALLPFLKIVTPLLSAMVSYHL